MDYDPEELIAAVRKRPVLYDKSLPKHNDKTAKNCSWMEVAQEITDNWDDLGNVEKEYKAKELQSKWRNLRDNFRREISDRNQSSSHGAKKKTKYRFFKQLSFLLPYVTTDNVSRFNMSLTMGNEITENLSTSNKRERKYTVYRSIPKKIRKTKESTLNLIQANTSNKWTEENEDRDFCKSLVPTLSKLSDEDKLSAKIEILNVLRRFSSPKNLKINNETDNQILTFNPDQRSSLKMESTISQLDSSSTLQAPLDSSIQDLNQTTTTLPVVPYKLDIRHMKADVEEN